MKFIPFTAQTRMSGVDFNGRRIRKGAGDSVAEWVRGQGGSIDPAVSDRLNKISAEGATPLLVADGTRVLGVVALKDIVKAGMRDRFDRLRAMGIKTIMITGDNPLTAATIAHEAGVDDFLAEATPEEKLAFIRKEQEGGKLVAMTGDGTNDAPALAQADVGVAMNTGTQAAEEAGNMVDLDSNPTKLIEIVEIGKQLLMTRGSLTTFSIANDVAKYFAILPAMFAATYPALERAQRHAAGQPESAILSAVIFNALVIIALIPLALRGVKYRPLGAARILRATSRLRRRRRHRPVRRHQAHRLDRPGPAPGLRRDNHESRHTLTLYVIVLTVLLGGVYPAAVTAVAQFLWKDKANGSFVTAQGSVVGSELIGQTSKGDRYLRPRPAGAGKDGYDVTVSTGRNYGPTDNDLAKWVTDDVAAARANRPGDPRPVPADLVTAGSGLDPHLSPDAVLLQASRSRGRAV